MAPPPDAPDTVPRIVVVPLLGFDEKGARLGYGKGHYDRALTSITNRPLLIGFAFSSQELPDIPSGPHDIPLDAVVTETGFRKFG